MKLSDFATLSDAKLYETTQPKLIHRDTMNSLLASANLYVGFKAMALDSQNPFQNLIAAFLDSTEYNFMVGNSTGDRQIQALDTMIAVGGDLGAKLAALKPVILSIANPTVNPFENKTEHDFQVAKGTIQTITKTSTSGWVKITVSEQCEAHRPRVFIEILGVRKYATAFDEVSEPKDYIVQVPKAGTYFIDNAYGVIS